jgi:hypothetical protein
MTKNMPTNNQVKMPTMMTSERLCLSLPALAYCARYYPNDGYAQDGYYDQGQGYQGDEYYDGQYYDQGAAQGYGNSGYALVSWHWELH